MSQTFAAPVMDNISLSGGMHVLRVTMPHEVATQVRPGQFFHVRAAAAQSFDPLWRRALPAMQVDVLANEVAFLIMRGEPGADWLTDRREGDTLDIFGPLGAGFVLGGNQKHLLLVAEGGAIAPLVHLADTATGSGSGSSSMAEVVLLAGAATLSAHLPVQHLPEAVEVSRATDDGTLGAVGAVSALVPPYLDWADVICASGSLALYETLRVQLRAHRGVRTPPAQAYIWQPFPCGIGVCRGCIVETRREPKLGCTDGPVFALTDLVG